MKCTAGGQVRRDRGDHRALDRADVGDGGAGLQARRDLGGDLGHRADRHAEHHEIGALDRGGGGVEDLGEAEAGGLGAGGGAAGVAGDADAGMPARRMRVADRGGDQAEADQRHPAVGHQARTFMKSATASATRAQASASPTVMRKRRRQLVAGDPAHDDAAGAERAIAGLGLGGVAEAGEQEVRLRRVGGDAGGGERGGEAGAVAGVLGAAEGGVVGVLHRGLGGERARRWRG